MDYYFAHPRNIREAEINILEDEARHISQVMRKQIGEAIRVVDGAGMMYDATIVSLTKETVRCAITATHERANESRIHLTLAVGILKNSSLFDFLVEKATELGVAKIVPLLTSRTIPRHAREERWRKIAFAAMKQSGRCVLPDISALTDFRTFVANSPAGTQKFIPHEAHGTETFGVQAGDHPVVVCIGPEGGFSEEEIAIAVENGFEPVTLGPRRLRTETAAVVAAARLLQQG